MDLSDDSSRGSSSKSSRSKSQSGSEKSAKSKSKSCVVTRQQIEQFCAVTGSTEDVARTLIEACRGNLERAVDMHMEGLSENPQPSGAQEEEYVRAPIPQKQEVLVESGYEGYGFGFKGKKRIVKSVFDSFRNFEVETKLQESRLRETNGLATPVAGASMSGKRTLEELFRPPIDMMFNGNLLNARDTGKTVKKWIMVNIQNISEFRCQLLNRDVWSQKSIKNLVRENFLFLQLYMDSEEGQRYMNFYKVNQWPYVAVLDPRTGELMVEWNYSETSAYETLIAEFLATTSWGDEEKSACAPSEPKKRRETILDASEDDQLQAAIRASLAASTAQNQKAPVSDDEFQSDEDEDQPTEWFDSESDSRASEPRKTEPEPPQPVGNRLEASGTADDDWERHLGPEADPISSIVFRFPDGSKEQKALPCTSTLMAVVKYAARKGFPRDKFELMANFPKRLLLTMDSEMTLKDAGLFPHDTIFVQAR
ncbi:hypothetical protein DAPPUDRAFT_190703 [Daphnia pulex]|uniref:Uncharacterized protein n=1 Tax=Daphnia pulex TaxID=6669 RepID=E9FTF8_DAPPU|nr:hypothetical protein DAPPUDRAFT_190703 [Daphnia pulex]|eukprot:EFX89353.1 hypothetical protein DAPPUDRAFT_190703 [Daphnia pulex]